MNKNRPQYHSTKSGHTLIVRDGRRRRRGLTLVKTKKGNKGGCKEKQKGGDHSLLAQSNLSGDIVASVNVEDFGNVFVCKHPPDVTRVAFQNCGPQPQRKHAHKARSGFAAIVSGKYDVILVAEHGLNPVKLQPQ